GEEASRRRVPRSRGLVPVLRLSHADRRAGRAEPPARGVRSEGIRGGRWPDDVRRESRRQLSPGRRVRRLDPQGRPAARSPDRAADHVRAGDQSEDREGARPHVSALYTRGGRPRHRVTGIPPTTYLTVRRVRGPGWNAALPLREQTLWAEHAAFMNAL